MAKVEVAEREDYSQYDPKWENEDAIRLREFFRSSTGQRMMPKLLSRQPRVTKDDLKNIEVSALKGAKLAGYLEALDDLIRLQEGNKQ